MIYDWVETDFELAENVSVEYYDIDQQGTPTNIKILPCDRKGIYYKQINEEKTYLKSVTSAKIVVNANDGNNVWIVVNDREIYKFNTNFKKSFDYNIKQTIAYKNCLYVLLDNNAIHIITETKQWTFGGGLKYLLTGPGNIAAIHIFANYLCILTESMGILIYDIETQNLLCKSYLPSSVFAGFAQESIESIKIASVSANDFHYLAIVFNVASSEDSTDTHIINIRYHRQSLLLYDTKKLADMRVKSIFGTATNFVLHIDDQDYIYTKAFDLEGHDIGTVAKSENDLEFVTRDAAISENHNLVLLIPSVCENDEQVKKSLIIVDAIIKCFPEDTLNDTESSFFQGDFPTKELRACEEAVILMTRITFEEMETVYKGIKRFNELVSVDGITEAGYIEKSYINGIFDKALYAWAFSILDITFKYHVFIQVVACTPVERSLELLARVGDILHPIVYHYVSFSDIMKSSVVDNLSLYPSSFNPDEFPIIAKKQVRNIISSADLMNKLNQKNLEQYLGFLRCPTLEQKMKMANLKK